MAKMGKRKYPAVYDKHGKWFTGYEGDIYTGEIPENLKGNSYWEDRYGYIKNDDHVTRKLELKYVRYSRGRSAANIILQDKEGKHYALSMSGFDILIKLTQWSRASLREEGYVTPEGEDKFDITCYRDMASGGEWYSGTFCQTKQGQNYFIEPCEVN